VCPLTWHSAKDGFAECPLSQHSANNLFAFFLEMALPSAGSRALGKPDPALGKSSKTYPNRRFPDSHTAHAHTPIHRRPPACCHTQWAIAATASLLGTRPRNLPEKEPKSLYRSHNCQHVPSRDVETRLRVCLDPRKMGRKGHIGHCSTL